MHSPEPLVLSPLHGDAMIQLLDPAYWRSGERRKSKLEP
jgi:hypothetical protein